MGRTIPVRNCVVDVLRREILSLRFAPGQKLVERDLCELTGASRTALREGLRQLEVEGLVEIVPNRGPLVPDLSPGQAQDIYEMRICLERHLAGQAALRANGREILALKGIRERVIRAIGQQDRIALTDAKVAYYDWLLAIGDNEEIDLSMRRLLGRSSLIWPKLVTTNPLMAEDSATEFGEIVDAISEHDERRAAAAAEVHLQSALKAVLEHLEDEP